MRRRVLTIPLLALCAPLAAATLDVAWFGNGKVATLQLHQGAGPPTAPVGPADMVPLGSLWKLFVYVYAADTGLATPDYHCAGRLPDETYCCAPGQSVERDAALAQSCGPFFAPARLGVRPDAWRRYWHERLGAQQSARTAWLLDPDQLAPATLVRLDTLLAALASVPPGPRAEAEAALLRVVLDGRGADTVRWFGSRLRVKTYSWHRPGRTGERLGGGAGWLANGTPVWFGGADSSSGVFKKWAPQLAAALPAAVGADGGCVLVDYFARYPLRAVQGPAGPAHAGPLVGRHVVLFENGQRLAFASGGEMTLVLDAQGRPQVQGRFAVNEYIARVIDREGSAAPAEAAKALAVAARSYLQQHARPVASCQQIADSSARQRVSPNPASPAALAVARWTDQLVIQGQPVRYHGQQPGPGVMAWTEAVEQARAGRWFDAILAKAYPNAVLATVSAGERCARLHDNEAWLARALPQWERVMRREPGYERPDAPPAICALAGGAPYSEQSRNRIFMAPLSTREDRITLAHEYLHIGLRHHPRGQDEAYIEQLARRLADQPLERL